MLIQSRREDNVIRCARELGELMRKYCKDRPIEVLGPSSAQLSRINNVFRWKLLVKCKEEQRLRNFIRYCLEKYRDSSPAAAYVVMMADIDPTAIQ